MAERIQVELVDDLDGSPAQYTVTFALDGVTYEIDLNERHARQFRSLLDRYVKQARTPKPTTTRQQERDERRVRKANKDLTEQIRGAARRSRERMTDDSEEQVVSESETIQQAERTDRPTESEQPKDGAVPVENSTSQAKREQRDAHEQDEDDAADSDSERVPAVVMPQFSSAE